VFLFAGVVLKIISNTIYSIYLITFVFGTILASTNHVFANEADRHSLDRITPVSQLDNIDTRDWQWQALKSFSQRHNITINFHGDRSLTRFEFAVELNAILNQIARVNTNQIGQADLTLLQRLQTEFATELASLQKQRVEVLEQQVSQLETQQISTTTTLSGQALFAISSAVGDEKADGSGEEIDDNLILSDRLRLNFDSSFTGKDRLRVRLQANNIPGYDDATGTAMARLGFEGDSENQFELSKVEYRSPIGDRATVYLGAVGSGLDDFTGTVNSLIDSSSRGAISRFGRRNAIYRQGSGTGIGLRYEFNEVVSLRLGYAADDAEEPEAGLAGGAYGAIAQLNLEPSDTFDLGLIYVHSYNNTDTGTGSELANDPFDDLSNSVSANSYGLSTSWRISPNFNLSGWIGMTNATATDLPNNPDAEILNYAIAFAFPNLGGENSLAGVVIGQPPKVTSNDLGTEFQDRDTSLHLEMFYRFPVSEDISITPGVLIITNPEHDDNNDTLYVGTVRTVLEF
jgi:Carbohydrate-selective porin, OprB family